MRIAVSGSHGTGKSTLIAAFLAACPEYRHEPEAFELLGDDVELTPSEGPTEDGLRLLLGHTISTLRSHSPGDRVVFERSPVDYLAYAAASRSWPRGSRTRFLKTAIPGVRRSLSDLDVIAVLPLPDRAEPSDENPRFRRRVDAALRRALFDDDHDLLSDEGAPRVIALPSQPDRRLAEVIRLARGR